MKRRRQTESQSALARLLALCDKSRQEELEAHLYRLTLDSASAPTIAQAFMSHGAPLYEGDWLNELLASALLTAGKTGIAAAGQLLLRDDLRVTKSVCLLRHLWRLYSPNTSDRLVSVCTVPRTLIPRSTEANRSAALEALRRFFAATLSDPFKFGHLGLFMNTSPWFCPAATGAPEAVKTANAFAHEFLRLLTTTSLRISDQTIEQYLNLLATFSKEEDLQAFLEENPIFLDPLAKAVVPKHRLGSDLITDFVLETLTGSYVVVEIERPDTPVFNKAGDFSPAFSHALRQVLDFQDWVASNVAYAQSKLPGIVNPHGVLVLGTFTNFSPDERRRMNQFQFNSRHIDVLGFDSLASRAQTLLNSLIFR